LYLGFCDLYGNNERPAVTVEQSLKEVIMEITKKRLGMTAVLNNAGALAGVVTDGDLRRMLEKTNSIENIQAGHIMTENPKTIDSNELAVNALDLMRNNNITQLIVVENKQYAGVIHLHDLIREGII
jgi:arabinose-5-phosphate isomerase